jgi:hypothetical protein
LAPWLQPGAEQDETTSNRFNGLPCCVEAVETALLFIFVRNHRAEAAVLMRRDFQGMKNRLRRHEVRIEKVNGRSFNINYDLRVRFGRVTGMNTTL